MVNIVFRDNESTPDYRDTNRQIVADVMLQTVDLLREYMQDNYIGGTDYELSEPKRDCTENYPSGCGFSPFFTDHVKSNVYIPLPYMQSTGYINHFNKCFQNNITETENESLKWFLKDDDNQALVADTLDVLAKWHVENYKHMHTDDLFNPKTPKEIDNIKGSCAAIEHVFDGLRAGGFDLVLDYPLLTPEGETVHSLDLDELITDSGSLYAIASASADIGNDSLQEKMYEYVDNALSDNSSYIEFFVSTQRRKEYVTGASAGEERYRFDVWLQIGTNGSSYAGYDNADSCKEFLYDITIPEKEILDYYNEKESTMDDTGYNSADMALSATAQWLFDRFKNNSRM